MQKALAQFVGVRFKLFRRAPAIPLTPVAFSFGWVAYAFMSLISTVGDNELMPTPDCPSIVINCNNGFVRENRSWILGRILRDHESIHEVDNKISIRIDIFAAKRVNVNPDIDGKWIIGWIVILVQQIIAAVPWIIDGNWSIFMVTLCGTIGALVTGGLSQWRDDKWPNIKLPPNKRKIMCLTRGNGHRHAMVVVGDGVGWDLEALATAPSKSRPETRLVCTFLTVWWTLLLITVSGIKQDTWYLIGVGGLGMLQNVYAAGAIRTAGAFNLHLQPFQECPLIIGYRQEPGTTFKDDSDSDEQIGPNAEEKVLNDDKNLRGVMGALMALETVLPKAGASLLNVFFPGGLQYEEEMFIFNRDKRFWKRAYRRMGKPVIPRPKPLTSRPTQVSDENRSGSTVDINRIPSSHLSSEVEQIC